MTCTCLHVPHGIIMTLVCVCICSTTFSTRAPCPQYDLVCIITLSMCAPCPHYDLVSCAPCPHYDLVYIMTLSTL